MTRPGHRAVPTASRWRRLPRVSRILLVAVALVALAEAAAIGGRYLLYSRHYVSTDNAQVNGDQMMINAPATGVVAGWSATQGSTVRRHQVLGHITIQGSQAQPGNAIRAPGAGTVAASEVMNGVWVRTGDPLALAYDFATLYVTARVPEEQIARVRPGATVDIEVDAFAGTAVSGLVSDIESSAAGQFTIYPGPDTDPTNPRKVDQYIPVKIAFTRTGGAALRPGMNVTVHIHADR